MLSGNKCNTLFHSNHEFSLISLPPYPPYPPYPHIHISHPLYIPNSTPHSNSNSLTLIHKLHIIHSIHQLHLILPQFQPKLTTSSNYSTNFWSTFIIFQSILINVFFYYHPSNTLMMSLMILIKWYEQQV